MNGPLAVCGWLWLAWLGYWVLSWTSAARTQVQEPAAARLRHRLGSALAAVLLCNPSWALPSLVWLSGPARWAGVPLTAAGIGFAVWARAHIGRFWSADVVLKEGHELVRTGPYAWTRHPIYTGVLLALLGTAVAGGRAAGLAGAALGFLVFDRKRRREEALLSTRFGPAYDAYRREVPALLPKLR